MAICKFEKLYTCIWKLVIYRYMVFIYVDERFLIVNYWLVWEAR